ncbi:hypothetical protein [Acinetobacter sp. Tr-809]|uniref:hypothetical protein n=1 Tax=Acinetobacter sp. Tr-809 TaxID=2608324 RepID=UPI003A4C7F32
MMNVDPTGLYIVNNKDGTMTIRPNIPQAPSLTIPVPRRWSITATNLTSSSPSYHAYNYTYSIPIGGSSALSTMQRAIVNQPTPGVGAASAKGTAINASPSDYTSLGQAARSAGAFIAGASPVVSYSVNNATGSWVFNVTQQGHPLSDGYVLRGAVTNSSGGINIINYGEGTSWLQSRPVMANFINEVWKPVSQSNVNAAFPNFSNSLNLIPISDDALSWIY